MNYRLAFVFSYERFENALICIISFGPSTRFRQTFLFFAKTELRRNFWNSLPKGFLWRNNNNKEPTWSKLPISAPKWKSLFCQTSTKNIFLFAGVYFSFMDLHLTMITTQRKQWFVWLLSAINWFKRKGKEKMMMMIIIMMMMMMNQKEGLLFLFSKM